MSKPPTLRTMKHEFQSLITEIDGTVVATSPDSESYFATAVSGPLPSSPRSVSHRTGTCLRCRRTGPSSSSSSFLEKRTPRARSRPSRFAPSRHPRPCHQILVTSRAISLLRPFLNEDPCGLLAAVVLPCWFLPAVSYALPYPL